MKPNKNAYKLVTENNIFADSSSYGEANEANQRILSWLFFYWSWGNI